MKSSKKCLLVLILVLLLTITISCSPNNEEKINKLENEIEELKSLIEESEKVEEEITKQSEAIEKPVEEEVEEETNEEPPKEEIVEEVENVEDSLELIGTRTSPAGIGEVFNVMKDDWLIGLVSLEIELKEVTSGDEAWDIVKNANMFNEEPGEGEEYILAKFRVKVIDTEGDEPFELNHALFSVVSGEGIEYADWTFVSGLEPDMSADLYEGAEHEGWTSFFG